MRVALGTGGCRLQQTTQHQGKVCEGENWTHYYRSIPLAKPHGNILYEAEGTRFRDHRWETKATERHTELRSGCVEVCVDDTEGASHS